MALKFDLVDEPWIPCLELDERACELGIREVLLRAHQLREIYDDSPLTTIALHRVLLAILQRCWADDTRGARTKQWKNWWQDGEGQFPASPINEYLEKWRASFDLFSEKRPFFQTAGLEMSESSDLSRLALEEQLTSALFAHDESPQWRAPSAALAARLIVSTQSFALGFGKSSRAQIEGAELDPPYSADAILLRGVTVWLAGHNLFQTLMLNLVPQESKRRDKPCWELPEAHELRDVQVDGKRQSEPARGVMDRFTWQSRLLRLLPEIEDGRIVVRRLYFTQGRSLNKDVPDFDPMKSYRKSKKEGFLPVALSEQKAAWRDSHALLQCDKGAKRPDGFEWAAQLVADSALERRKLYDLHIVGMAAEPGKAGKFLLWRHDRMPAPAAILNDVDLVATMRQANEDAEWVAGQMNERMRRVCRLFLAPECEMPDGRKPHPDDVTRLTSEFDPRRAYWPRLETHFYQFLHDLPSDRNRALESWRNAVQNEAENCFRAATHTLGSSPRALRAAAHVATGFRTKDRFDAWKATFKKGAAKTTTQVATTPTQNSLIEEVATND